MTLKAIICRQCNGVAPKTGPRQFYCAPCSDARHKERQAAYSRTTKPKARAAAHAAVVVDAAREAGAEASVAAARTMLDIGLDKRFKPRWYVRIKVPNVGSASKNHIFGLAGERGHLFKRQESKALQATIAAEVALAVRSLRVANNKVWIDLLVQKKNHKSDAINVVDLVCDGIKQGLGVDDRWFSISRLDWEIVKTEPQIFIGVFQEAAEDAQACSNCGKIAPHSAFSRSSGSTSGYHRVCRECLERGRALTRSRRLLRAAEAQL